MKTIHPLIVLFWLFIHTPYLFPQSISKGMLNNTPDRSVQTNGVKRSGAESGRLVQFASEPRFESRDDGRVVVDHLTGLMWQRSGSADIMIGERAEAYVDSLNKIGFAGYSDWRLPTAEEALSLVAWERPRSNSLFIDPIFDREQPWIITATRVGDWPVVVYFTRGELSSDPIGYFGTFVRLVRSLPTPDIAQNEAPAGEK